MADNKFNFEKFWKIIAWFFGAIAAVFSAFSFSKFGEDVINYYCAVDNPFIFGIYLDSYAICPFYVTIGYIIFFTVVVMILVALIMGIVGFSRKKGGGNWRNVTFAKWNPKFNDVTPAIGGVEITNNSEERINDCYAELIAIYEENNGEYFDAFEGMKSQIPCLLAWQIHNEIVYKKIKIEKTVSRYLAIAYRKDASSFHHFIIKGEKDFVYSWPSVGHVVAEVKIWGKIDTKTISKRLFIEMFSNGHRLTVVEITDKMPQLNPLLSSFSFHLNEMVRGKEMDISGASFSFINRAKVAPPFLGFNESIISKPDEKILTEYFHAVSFNENNRIIGGKSYQITNGDNAEIIAKKVYKSKKFAHLVNAFTFPNGSWIDLPYANLDDPKQSSKSIDELMSVAKNEEVIIELLGKYYLPNHEALEMIRIIYDAAQKTLKETEQLVL